jgi:tetratricopeptide (TPR) repeat protein
MSERNLTDVPSKAELDQYLEDAIRLKNRKEFQAAVDVLRKAVKKYPQSAAAQGLLGSIYLYELDNAKKAVTCFRKTARLSPHSESASLGLFHALWETDKQAAALEEMKRFQRVSHSKEYDEILHGILKSG